MSALGSLKLNAKPQSLPSQQVLLPMLPPLRSRFKSWNGQKKCFRLLTQIRALHGLLVTSPVLLLKNGILNLPRTTQRSLLIFKHPLLLLMQRTQITFSVKLLITELLIQPNIHGNSSQEMSSSNGSHG